MNELWVSPMQLCEILFPKEYEVLAYDEVVAIAKAFAKWCEDNQVEGSRISMLGTMPIREYYIPTIFQFMANGTTLRELVQIGVLLDDSYFLTSNKRQVRAKYDLPKQQEHHEALFYKYVRVGITVLPPLKIRGGML